MTAVALFDVLARAESSANPGGSEPAPRIARFAEQLVSAVLSDLERVREYERESAPTLAEDPALTSERDRSLWRLYAEWADDAEQVLGRAKSLARAGTAVVGTDRLDDAIGRVRARLSVTPDRITKAKEQVRQGQFVPAKELRDELHARLRA